MGRQLLEHHRPDRGRHGLRRAARLLLAAAGSALASHDSGGSRVYFTDADNHVHELAWVGSYWNTTDLTAVATLGPAGQPAGHRSRWQRAGLARPPAGAGCTSPTRTTTSTSSRG